MTHITTCPLCGDCYQESSEERANAPDRCCAKCWTAQARQYQERVPPPAKHTPMTCRSCGKEIVWMKTVNGKNIPVDAETAETGDDMFDAQRHTTHFATCPQADQHRKKP